MHDPAKPIRESYALTAEEAASALAATVVRAQMSSVEETRIGRLERRTEGVDDWGLRILVAGAPMALGIYLLVKTSWHQLGLALIGLSGVAYFLVVAFQRVRNRVDKAVDGAVDPMIARSSRGGLKKAIETGAARVLHGNLEARFEGRALVVSGGGQTFELADTDAAWLADAGPHLVVGDKVPELRSQVGSYVVLSAGGSVASAIRAARAVAR
ncbi:MAG: hypothetical protein AAF196_13465 [Planctomycetota bacterium]